MLFPSSTILLSFIFLLHSSCAYVIDLNRLIDQESSDNRVIRTTKFPRIGRSNFEPSEEMIVATDGSSSSEEKHDDDENLFHQRSVLFPRIGKRAFHNLLWGNTLSNPHRMIDGQGRVYLNGYDYHIHQPQSRYRGKRFTIEP